ncbi:hypothetical protein SUGI_0788060 [Cryptomeria japonica]|uniref:uncharacterized protein LOC131028949 n=1 Tax=Cryptomeria japonica TaxID=3369 RepID=UPI002414A899|nr:uncharacterized protein LOC131028949 [Cryptomeria japonica]GLJ38656.1 hypothetical protein SUGI_0788060 [Cryptomeria japonica]
MASEICENSTAKLNNGADLHMAKQNAVPEDSIQRLVEECLPDLDATVQACVQMSMEGVGGLGIEHWVGDGKDRPFRSADIFSYKALLDFVSKNRHRICDSQDFLHYIGPWYDWALGTAESKLTVTWMRRSEFADLGKEELVKQIREEVLTNHL